MSWRNVKLIFCREVRDQLRDRRTLFMIAVLPLLLYPALGIGMMQMMSVFREQPRTVVLLGEKNLPAEPKLSLESERLHVYSDGPPEKDEPDPQAAELLAQGRKIRDQLARLTEVEAADDEARRTGDSALALRLDKELLSLRSDLGKIFASSSMQVLIIVPEEFGENIHKMDRQIAARKLGAGGFTDYPRPKIVENSADEKSHIAYQRVKEALGEWERKILAKRLFEADLPVTLSEPVKAAPIDLALQDQFAASLWSKLFPALLVIMAVTGAFYPAIDLGAGEKERGTMETLLICPASRVEIVLGKFLTVMSFSMSTALLNLVSMGLTGKYMVSVAGGGMLPKIGDLSFPPISSLVWILVLLVPLAALFSALCLSLATFARSSKEGQYYLTPLLMVTLGLTVFCLSPAVEITPFYSVMPVVGVALLLKAMLLAPVSASSLYLYAIPVLVTSIGYSLLALWWAIEQFAREDVLFREAERFELGLWIRHLLREKEPTPSFTEAGVCFAMIMLLQFGLMRFMQQALAAAAATSRDTIMMRLLMIQQLAIIATPALLMGVMLTASVVRTFRLRFPGWRMLAAAAVLPFAMHPLSLELSASLQWFFPPLPQSVIDVLKTMGDTAHPWWFVLLTFAVVPAICEEIAFRGFILSGFQRTGRVWLAVGLSSLTFGVMHMIPQQVFNATLLGLVLGLIAVGSKSLFPCILFHFVYNSLEILRGRISGRISEAALTGTTAEWFVRIEDGGIRYQWTTLAIAAVVAIVLLRWLVNRRDAEPIPATGNVPTPQSDRLPETGVAGKPPIGVS